MTTACCADAYAQMKERKDTKYAVSASYLEIYNETIQDLLNLKGKGLQIKWDAAQGFYVPGLKSMACADMESMLEVGISCMVGLCGWRRTFILQWHCFMAVNRMYCAQVGNTEVFCYSPCR